MDYLEGFLIGPVWTDTDYETKRHTMIHVLLAFLVAVWYIFLQVFPANQRIMAIIPAVFSGHFYCSNAYYSDYRLFLLPASIYARIMVLSTYVIKFY